MSVINNFARFLDLVFTIYVGIIIGRAIISWVSADPHNPIVRFLYTATEPLLSRIRRIIPVSMSSVDFSPVILILGVMFLQHFIVTTLYGIAAGRGFVFIIAAFVMAIVYSVKFILTAYMWIIIGRAIISWVNADPYNPIVRFLYEATEPLLSRIRRLLPFSIGGIDFSPMVLIIGIMFLQIVIGNIYDFAAGLG